MSTNFIPEHFRPTFENSVTLLSQQNMPLLAGAYDSIRVSGEQTGYHQLGEATATKRSQTGATQTNRSSTERRRRWVLTDEYEYAEAFDRWDPMLLDQLSSPESDNPRAHLAAFNRNHDQIIIDALGGDAVQGKQPTTTVSFPAGQILANDTGSTGTPNNFNLAKMIALVGNIRAGQGQMQGEPLYGAITQSQLDSLLNNVDQINNSRYTDVKALSEGGGLWPKFEFMGVVWHVFGTGSNSAQLPKSGNDRTVYVWSKGGMKYGTMGRQFFADILPGESHALQLRTIERLGASRTEEPKVWACLCDETA